ncbi:hypothetical protein [Streptomyces sp. NPDC001165]
MVWKAPYLVFREADRLGPDASKPAVEQASSRTAEEEAAEIVMPAT